MASLTETAYVSRKGVNIAVIVLVVLLFIRATFGFLFGVWQKIFPPPPPPATVAFGKLPYPLAQNSVATPSAIINYSLETATGGLPQMPPSVKVYFMIHNGPSFGSFDRMKNQASRLGFMDIPKKVGSTAWRYVDPDSPLHVLDIDEISNNFRLTYNYLSDQSLFNDKNFSSREDTIASARSFFEGARVFTQDLRSGQPNVTFFKFDSGALVPTTSLSNSDAVGVTFNRADIDKAPVVSPDPRQGLVSALLSGSSNSKKKILEGRYFYSQINMENFATYPVISSAAALEMLKTGKAIYASLPTPIPTNITVRKVYLAYLDPYPSQSYLQPVLVFSDEKGFVAYVPIISSNWLE